MGQATPRGNTGVPWRSRTVQVVLASTALAPLGVPLISPALPVFRDEFLLTDAEASLLLSGYFLVGIVLSPLIGVLADQFGRKRVLVAGLVTFGTLGGAIAFAPNFEAVMALRVLQGTGAAAIFITTVTIISDTFEGPQRNAVLGANVAVLSATAALFPVLGGTLVTVTWDTPFLAYFTALPVALFAALALEESRPGTGRQGIAFLNRSFRTILTPATLALFGVTFLTEFLAFGVVFTAVPFLLEDVLSSVLIGATLLVAETASMATASASGRLVRRFANERLIAMGFACYGVGFLLAWIAPNPVVVGGGLLVAGAGIGILLPSVDAAVGDRVSADYRAGAFSLRNSTTFLGRTLGPITFAGVAGLDDIGYEELLLTAGLLAVIVAILVRLRLPVPSGSRD